jgi:hypothetical protein
MFSEGVTLVSVVLAMLILSSIGYGVYALIHYWHKIPWWWIAVWYAVYSVLNDLSSISRRAGHINDSIYDLKQQAREVNLSTRQELINVTYEIKALRRDLKERERR